MKFYTKVALKILPSRILIDIYNEYKIHLLNFKINSFGNKAKRKIIEERSIKKLHIGCGNRILKDWINTDLYNLNGVDFQLNLRKPLVFSSSYIDAIYCEHVLEHFTFEDALQILKEFYRVLKPGAMLRIGVPDAGIYFKKYMEKDKAYFYSIRHLGGAKNELRTPIEVINQMFRMGGAHLYAWDFETLNLYLNDTGFVEIYRKGSGESSKEFEGCDDPSHDFETLYIECRKAKN